MRSYHRILLTGFFIGLLAVCLLGSIFHWDFYEVQGENRRLADFPDFAKISISTWPENFEAWFNDHFGFRNTFIRRYNRMLRPLGRDDRVVHGENDWLYYNRDVIFKDFLGYRKPSADELGTRLKRLESRRDGLKAIGIEYLFVVVPNKLTLYPEHLPKHIQSMRCKTNREYLMEIFTDRFDANVLDLTPLLRKEKRHQILFHPTDTHWNSYGAYIGYTRIIHKARTLLPALPDALKISELKTRTSAFSGDVARMTGTPKRYLIPTDHFSFPGHTRWEKHVLDHPAFLAEDHLPRDGNAPFTIHNPDGIYNAVVFHDSFAKALMGFLPATFKNTTFIWHYSDEELLQAAIELCQPDIVIEQVVERFLVEKDKGALPDEVHINVLRESNGF